MVGPFRQQVPRPPGGAAAWPPPWATRAAPPAGVPLELVRAALALPMPPRPARQHVEAAVLLACYAGADGEAVAVLIRRAAHLGRDPGHVALPGGLVEPGEDLVATALREADEEVGLAPGAVEVLGPLEVVERPRRSGAVAAFVGLLAGRPELAPSPEEVEAVLEVPLAALLADGVAWEERWPLPASPPAVHRVRFFSCELLGDDLVWGVTARILWDLLDRVTRVATGGRPVPGARLD